MATVYEESDPPMNTLYTCILADKKMLVTRHILEAIISFNALFYRVLI